MGTLIDGKAIAKKIRLRTGARVAELKQKNITPKLEVILVGADKPSETYVRKKGEAAIKVGMEFELHKLPAEITTDELIKKVEEIQHRGYLSGLIVQLPLPKHIDTGKVLNAIPPELDVDCLTDKNLGKVVMHTNYLVPPTPGAVMSILHDLNIPMKGKKVTIVGTGPLVGKPLSIMMTNEEANITTCNIHTKDTKERCLAADIIISGVGKKNLITGDMVKPGATVIDTGVSFDADGKMFGDVNVDEVVKKAAFVTPTPGGVGPITVARLLWNTVLCAEENDKTGWDSVTVKCPNK